MDISNPPEGLSFKFSLYQQNFSNHIMISTQRHIWDELQKNKDSEENNNWKAKYQKIRTHWSDTDKIGVSKLRAYFYRWIFMSDRSFKFFGWSKRGKSGYINSVSNSFSMSFFVALSSTRFYGILGTEGTGNSKKFIHFLSKVLNERKKLSYQEANKFVLIMDNASIHKTLEVSTFIIDSKVRTVTIPPYEPSLNPVEKFILAIKSKLRQKKQSGQ